MLLEVWVQKKRNFMILISKSDDAAGQYCLKWSMSGISYGMAFNILDMLEAQLN